MSDKEREAGRIVNYFVGGLETGHAAYHIANLREALKVAQDTGDWHGELRALLDLVQRAYDIPDTAPNIKAEDQAVVPRADLVRVTQERDDLEGRFIGELVAARRERDEAVGIDLYHRWERG